MRISLSSNHGWKPTLKMLRNTSTCPSYSPSLVSPLRTQDTTQPSGTLSSQLYTRSFSIPRRGVGVEVVAFSGSCSQMVQTIWMMGTPLLLPSLVQLRISYHCTQQGSPSSIPYVLGTAIGVARRRIHSKHFSLLMMHKIFHTVSSFHTLASMGSVCAMTPPNTHISIDKSYNMCG